MYGYIYKTTNLVNGKIYIGQHKAKTFDKYYYGSGYILKEAFKKYKPKHANFKCEILEWCETKDEISDREKYWINLYNAQNPEIGYNLNEGGQGNYTGSAKRGLTGKVKIIKEDTSKFIDLEELEHYLVLGWHRLDKAAAKKAARQKWKKEHPEEVRKAKLAWHKKHPRKNKYHERHKDDPEYKEKVKVQNAKYYEEHKEALKEYYRNYMRKKRKKG